MNTPFHTAYGIALALIIFALYWRPWILRAAAELVVLGAFMLAIAVWFGVLAPNRVPGLSDLSCGATTSTYQQQLESCRFKSETDRATVRTK